VRFFCATCSFAPSDSCRSWISSRSIALYLTKTREPNEQSLTAGAAQVEWRALVIRCVPQLADVGLDARKLRHAVAFLHHEAVDLAR
jgi:hypothetical protein